MESGKNNDFNRKDYLRKTILAFVHSESKGIHLAQGGLNALNKNSNMHTVKQDTQKRKILEGCLKLFRDSNFKALIQREKDKNGIVDLNDVTNITREGNLHKAAVLADRLTDILAEVVLGDLKRKYNMSSICSEGMIDKNAIKYVPEDKMSITLSDLSGDQVSIQHIGCLYYKTPFLDEYIYKYRVTRQSQKKEPIVTDVFASIDLNIALENPEYADALVNTVLSQNNIELSNSGGYIGDLSCTTQSPSQLKPNEEQILEDEKNGKKRMSYYRYQISQNYALEFLGDKMEAVKAYNEQQSQSKTKKDDEGR